MKIKRISVSFCVGVFLLLTFLTGMGDNCSGSSNDSSNEKKACKDYGVSDCDTAGNRCLVFDGACMEPKNANDKFFKDFQSVNSKNELVAFLIKHKMTVPTKSDSDANQFDQILDDKVKEIYAGNFLDFLKELKQHPGYVQIPQEREDALEKYVKAKYETLTLQELRDEAKKPVSPELGGLLSLNIIRKELAGNGLDENDETPPNAAAIGVFLKGLQAEYTEANGYSKSFVKSMQPILAENIQHYTELANPNH